jgi:hypothetical protein
VAELVDVLVQLVLVLWRLLEDLLVVGLRWSLVIAWTAWWLWAVNWQKTWPVLARGAWAPVVLLMLVAALVWSRLAPGPCDCLGFVTVPNFWWQLGGVGLLAALTLLCGWLQGVFGWTPAEINLEPPAPVDHHHGHGHH